MARTPTLPTEVARRPHEPPPVEVDGDVLRLRGEHDISTTDELCTALARAIGSTDGDLVLDLSDVEFIDVATLTIILGARELLRARDHKLVLRAPSRCVERLFDLCALGELLDVPRRDGSHPAGVGGALRTWVEVPPVGRRDGRSAALEPADSHVTVPVPVTRSAGS
jgi:anti-anti-sigma factor